MKRLIATCILLIATAGTVGHTASEVKKTCPVCKTEFKTMVDMLGTSFGMRLDLKKLGPIASPWRIPVCTKCKFVLYDDKIPEKDLAKCKEIVESKDYKKHSARASYFLLGILSQKLGKDDMKIAHLYLNASWQEEENKEHLKQDLGLSLKYFEAYLKDPTAKEPDAYFTALLLKGELLRRLGKFDEAKKHLDTLKEKKKFKGTFLGDIVTYEIELCNQKDAKPHKVSEVKKTTPAPAKAPSKK
jgi:uncharacterized protein (DUF2225 family)